MYRRHISQLRPGQILAKALYNERGEVLLGAGTVPEPVLHRQAAQRGVISVFLQDGLGDDVEPDDIVSEELRASTVTHLARAFDVIGTMAQGSRLNNAQRPQHGGRSGVPPGRASAGSAACGCQQPPGALQGHRVAHERDPRVQHDRQPGVAQDPQRLHVPALGGRGGARHPARPDGRAARAINSASWRSAVCCTTSARCTSTRRSWISPAG